MSFMGGVDKPRVTLAIPGNPTGLSRTYVFEPSRATALKGQLAEQHREFTGSGKDR